MGGQSVLKLASLPVWRTVNPGRVDDELKKFPALRRHWERLSGDSTSSKKRPASGAEEPEGDNPNQTFLPTLVKSFCATLDDATADAPADVVKFLERSVELWTDLMSQLPTRRFLRLVMLDNHVLVKCKASALYSSDHASHRLFRQLVDAFEHFLTFAVDDQSGLSLGRKEVEGQFYSRLQVRALPPCVLKIVCNKIGVGVAVPAAVDVQELSGNHVGVRVVERCSRWFPCQVAPAPVELEPGAVA
jgi:intron-binding protein aquarius